MYGKVGAQSLSSGTVGPLRLDETGCLMAQARGGKYAEAALAGRLFHSANINMVTTSTTLNTTFVGLGLCNPSGSGKNVIVHEFGYAFIAASGAGLILALALTDDTGFAQDTNAPILCARYGYATSVCYTDEGATITAPQIIKVITQRADAATSTFQSYPCIVDLGGSIVLPPGYAVVTDTTTAAGASTAQFSFMWEEVDVA